jgi:transposase-like protein
MKRSRYTEEQIIGILKEQEAGVPVSELCRKHGMSDATFYNWKSRRHLQTLLDPPIDTARLASRRSRAVHEPSVTGGA